ncbi:MAG: addiction module protein [Flavobacteriales bacterium]|nr:addiction module protein [Flavobacteriales bacterium]
MQGISELIQEASSLPIEARAKIVDSLLRTLNQPNTEIETQWTAVAKRRLAELKSGKVKSIPGDQVFEKILKRFTE